MHVGLNCVFLVPGETGGMEFAARELVRALVALGAQVTVFVGRDAAEEDFGAPTVVLDCAASSRRDWVRGEQLLLPGAASRSGCDVVHSLAATGPVRGRFRRVVTVNDLHYAVAPEAHHGGRQLGMRVLVPLAVRAAREVIVPSETTRDDVLARLPVGPAHVHVVPLGPGQLSRVAPTPQDELRARLELGRRPVLLTLSAPRPHKNVDGILRALALIDEAERPVLVAPGYATPYLNELRALAAELAVDVRFTGWVGDADLEGLFGLATAFVFASKHEGFGLPVVEAMARGVPVVCSGTGAVGEVAGDGAVLFDPSDPAAIAAALLPVLRDPSLRVAMTARGAARVSGFSWARHARATQAVYERAAGTRPPG